MLQPIGSTRLALKPNGGTFAVPIKGAEGVTVNIVVREAGITDVDFFDRLDANKDGVITRREFNHALRAEGDKPVLQPIDGGKSMPIASSGKNLPSLPKAEDNRFPAAAVAAKEYLESHKLLPFVRALLQTVVRDRPDDPYIFIAEQFRSAAGPQDKEEPIMQVLAEKAGSRLAEASLDGTLAQKMDQVDDSLKEKAQGALVSALFSDEGPNADAEDEDDEVEAAKARARDALGKALMGDVQDLDDAKERARNALHTALLGSSEKAARDGKVDEESTKAKARDAVAKALFTDQDDTDVELAKDKAREALGNVLAGPIEDEDLESSKEIACKELAAALLTQASGTESQDSPGDDALGKAERKKALLAGTKKELGKMNFALKTEVNALNESLSNLTEQRDSLRQKMNAL